MNASEYLPAHGENGNGNGHHNQDKKFSIQKAPIDPETLAIFEARRNAFAEPRRRMDRAKYMFAELCDRATNRSCPGFVRKGSVAVPDSVFARKFGVWESTIYTWKRQLEACGYVWISKPTRTDRWPMTVYHLACIHPRPNFDTQNSDGTSNGGPGRSAPGKVGEPTGNFDDNGKQKVWSHGARKPGQKSLPLATPHVTPVPWNDPLKFARKVKNQVIVAAIHDFARLSATAGNGCEPQPSPAVSHSEPRLTATAERGSQPQPNGAESHEQDVPPATANRVHKRVSVGRLRHVQRLGEGNPSDFEKWEAGLAKKFDRELRELKAELKVARRAATDAEDAADLDRRIAALESRIYGRSLPRAAKEPRRVVQVASEAPVETLTAKERELTATFAARLGKVRR